MSMTPFLEEVSQHFLEVYRDNLKNALRVLDETEALEFREQLAKDEPRKAGNLEGHTREEREESSREKAMSIAVAEAIRYALEKLQPK